MNSVEVKGQGGSQPNHDTTYYETYKRSVIARIFVTRKYTFFELRKSNDAPRLRYRPNSNISLGAGFTYRSISLNFGHGFSFLNQDKEKGKSKITDLQTRFYSRKWGIDLFGVFYKGYYLYPKGLGIHDPGLYYARSDIRVNLIGTAAYRIFNYRRFTLRPFFVQDEIQKRSAGSLLAGAEIYYGDLSGDSALVPAELSGFYERPGIKETRILQIGPGAGYAYTQVLPYNFFIGGSLTANVNLAHVRESGTSDATNHVSANVNLLYRLSAGYNGVNWKVVLFRINSRLVAKGHPSGNPYVLNTGDFRLMVAKRFHPGPRGKKLLRPIDGVLGFLGL